MRRSHVGLQHTAAERGIRKSNVGVRVIMQEHVSKSCCMRAANPSVHAVPLAKPAALPARSAAPDGSREEYAAMAMDPGYYDKPALIQPPPFGRRQGCATWNKKSALTGGSDEGVYV